MAMFVQLSELTNSNSIYINLDNVLYMRRLVNGNTQIVFGKNKFINVLETLDEINNKIEQVFLFRVR